MKKSVAELAEDAVKQSRERADFEKWLNRYHQTHSVDSKLCVAPKSSMLFFTHGPDGKPIGDSSNEIRERWEAQQKSKRREALENFLATKKDGDGNNMAASKKKTKTVTERVRKEHVTPRVGSKFKKTFKGKEFEMIVVKTDNGVGYQIGKKTFDHPNKAQAFVCGRPRASHGHLFWGIEEKG